MALNPDGAFSIGIKIGRRSLDMLLLDFTGQVRERLTLDYALPRSRHAVRRDRRAGCATLAASARPKRRERAARHRHRRAAVARRLADAARHRARAGRKWTAIDIRERIVAMTDAAGRVRSRTPPRPASPNSWPAAAAASRSFLYVFVDTFIGGGLVHRQPSARRRAAAMPAPSARCRSAWPGAPAAPPPQLLSVASLFNLEALLRRRRARRRRRGRRARDAASRGGRTPGLAARGGAGDGASRSTARPACSTSKA